MFGLGPASSAHHLLTDHHDTALKGAAGLHLARYTLTYTKEQIIIGCCIQYASLIKTITTTTTTTVIQYFGQSIMTNTTRLLCSVTCTMIVFAQHMSSVMWLFTCDWLLLLPPPPPPPPPPVPPPVPPPAPPLPALLDCWWLAISAILLSICSKRSRIDILNWLSGQTVGHRRTRQHTSSIQCAKKMAVFAITGTNNPVS